MKATKTDLAALEPHLAGVTVDQALSCFPGMTFVATPGELADIHSGKILLGESSVTVTLTSHASDKVSSIAVAVHRPGHAIGPLLDRLAAEYLPMPLAVLDAKPRDEGKSWLAVELMNMSASGHTATTAFPNIDLVLKVMRSKATLTIAANDRVEPSAMSAPPVVVVPEHPPIQPFFQPSPPVTTGHSAMLAQAASSGKAAVSAGARLISPSQSVAPVEAVIPRPKYSPGELAALHERLEHHLASDVSLDSLEQITEYRREFDAIASAYPDTTYGERAKGESAALGLLWLAVRFQGKVDVAEKLQEIIRRHPGTRAARVAEVLATD